MRVDVTRPTPKWIESPYSQKPNSKGRVPEYTEYHLQSLSDATVATQVKDYWLRRTERKGAAACGTRIRPQSSYPCDQGWAKE